MFTVLVTGGAGFIGSCIVDMLLSCGYRVAAVDNLSNGDMGNVNKDSTFYNADITDLSLQKIFEIEKPEYVIHTAAHINVEQSMQNPVSDAIANIVGSINVMECCKKTGVRKIVYSSTAAVYGNPLYLGIDEKHKINPVSFYGMSKQVTERYLELYNKLYGFKYTILRYANVYGPRQRFKGEGGVVPSFIIDRLREEKPKIYGSGSQTRDFIYVDDVARANALALNRGDNEIFNIGTGVEVSIKDLLKKLCEIMGHCSPIYMPTKKGDIISSYFDIRKAKDLLGWEPEYSLKEGLVKTVQWYSSFPI